MPDIIFDTLHLEQGFNFRQDVQDACGFITSMQIAKKGAQDSYKLAADISVKNPVVDGAVSPQQVVGVMRYFKWSGGLADPMEIKFNVCSSNRDKIMGLLHTSMPSTDVTFSFQIFYFDQKEALFYMAMGGNGDKPPGVTPLQGLIAKEGKEKLLLSLPSNLSNDTVKSPQNWDVDLTVMPAPLGQSVWYQYAWNGKLGKAWGITVAS